MTKTYEIREKLPSLQDYIDACYKNHQAAATLKRKTEKRIIDEIKKMPKFNNPIEISFLWIENDARRDPDNVAFAKKFILDAMVKTKKIKDDSRKFVIKFSDSFATGNHAKVVVTIREKK